MVDLADEKANQRRGIDHIGVTVASVVHDGKGNILMMKRGLKARDENGRWDILGGALEFGELIEDCLRRELNEELCTEPLDVSFLDAGDAHRIQNDIDTHWIWLLHAVRIDPSTVKIGEPHKISEIGWFNAKNLPAPLHSQFYKVLPLITKRKIII